MDKSHDMLCVRRCYSLVGVQLRVDGAILPGQALAENTSARSKPTAMRPPWRRASHGFVLLVGASPSLATELHVFGNRALARRVQRSRARRNAPINPGSAISIAFSQVNQRTAWLSPGPGCGSPSAVNR
jgi:hypothetical protein